MFFTLPMRNFNQTMFFSIRIYKIISTCGKWAWPNPRNGEMEMDSVANLAALQTPLAAFFRFKKAPKPYLVFENRGYCRTSARSCFPSAHTHTSLSLFLSLHLLSFCSARGREEQHFHSGKHRYYVACSNLTCKHSQNHSIAIVIILCVFNFIKRQLGYQDFCAD